MLDRHTTKPERPASAPKPDVLLASGLLTVLGGVWLLRLNDPFLLAMWGVAALVFGAVLIILGVGMLLRFWE
jgi:multisubunit Na+/H+ antiporter MnhG subunit